MKQAVAPVHAYPRLSRTDLLFCRLGGNGLGNLLFTWARCLSAATRRGWPIIWPTWKSVKPKNRRVNPYDHRRYDDLFSPTAEYLDGWRKPWLLVRRPHVPEQRALMEDPSDPCVVEFTGMDGKFSPFINDRALVRRSLLNMTRARHRMGYECNNPPVIGIHVRRGDFEWQPSHEQRVCRDNSALPLSWYIDTLQSIRATAGHDVPAQVFSDGTTGELAPLLALPAVRRVEWGSSVADLLALSRSRLLIASGSTFSMWASYLHQAPTLWHPGKLLQQVHNANPSMESEWAPGEGLPDWVGRLARRGDLGCH